MGLLAANFESLISVCTDEVREDIGPLVARGSSPFRRVGVRQSTMMPSEMLVNKWNGELENGVVEAENSRASSVDQTSVHSEPINEVVVHLSVYIAVLLCCTVVVLCVELLVVVR